MVFDRPQILVAACGNALAADDAFGPCVVQSLRKRKWSDVQIVDLGTKPAALLDSLPGSERLLIVDAVQSAGAAVGQLIDIDWFSPNRPSLVYDTVLSSHGLSIAQDIELARRLDMLPSAVRLIGCTIGSVQMGQRMQDKVGGQVPIAVRRICDHIRRWHR